MNERKSHETIKQDRLGNNARDVADDDDNILVYSIIMMFNKDLFPGQAIFANITFIVLIKLGLIRKGFLSDLTNKYIRSKLSE